MRFLEQIGRELALAWRNLRRSPTYTIVVVVTISVGIGATSTISSIIDIAFLQKLNVPNPDRIVRIQCADSISLRRGSGMSRCSFPMWRELRSKVRGLDGFAGYAMANVKLGGDLAGVEQPYGSFVTGNYFDVLAVKPQRGRFFVEDEASTTEPRTVVVISDVMWRTTFGGDEHILGRHVVMGSGEFTIIGVTAAGFSGVHAEGRTDFWLPYTTRLLASGRNDYENMDAGVMWTPMIGRLSDGASLAEVQTSLVNARSAIAPLFPTNIASTSFRAVMRNRLLSAQEAVNALATFVVALIVVGLVHVVACANVASLVLARVVARRRELGIRLCLGASRGRIIMQCLAEPTLLAVAGAVGGLIVARWLSGLITAQWFMSAMDRGLDARVMVIVSLMAALTAALFGLAPAMAATRRDPMDVLRSASPSRAADVGRGPADSILVLQAALSLVLLAQSLLLIGKFRTESAVDVGFADAQLVSARMKVADGHTRPADWEALMAAATTRAAGVPGVRSVGVIESAPLSFGGWYERLSAVGSVAEREGPRAPLLSIVGPGYFGAIGSRLVAGRDFLPTDKRVAGEKGFGKFDVAVVNETFAKLHWPGQDPIGQVLTLRNSQVRVVGVARDMRDAILSAVTPHVYFPILEWAYPEFTIVTRVDGDVDAAAVRVRSALATVPYAQAPAVRTLASIRADQLQVPRMLGLALTSCAALALLLSAIGLYGSVAMWAAGRRREIGVRLALGAQARNIYVMLMTAAGRFTAVGIGLGVILSVALVKVERARYGPSLVLDLPSVAIAMLIFGAATLLAAFVPARRAARADPSDVLRND